MPLDFEKYAMKGNEFLNKLEVNLGNDDRDYAARVLRNTFRVFRNHLTLEESFQLIAQLPMALKSVYVEGWKPQDQQRLKSADQLIAEIKKEEGNLASYDFKNDDKVLEAVRAVIQTLRQYISDEEIDQALGTLPAKVRSALESSTFEETDFI